MYHEQERDTLAFSHQLYAETPRQLAFQATSITEAEVWQRELRAKLTELVGGFPQGNMRLTTASSGLLRISYLFPRDGAVSESSTCAIFGYFLSPKPLNSSTPKPTILCLAGHGRGVDDIVGIEEDGTMRSEYGGYQNDFALQCVANGYTVLAIEQFGFGHRRGPRRASAGRREFLVSTECWCCPTLRSYDGRLAGLRCHACL